MHDRGKRAEFASHHEEEDELKDKFDEEYYLDNIQSGILISPRFLTGEQRS